MRIFESYFDIAYLCIVLALGIRLLPERQKGAKLFGMMAITLGLGDAFHLLPRVISHLSPGGFAAHGVALSWGKFITGITMTIFYLLFYFYYRQQSGDYDKRKKWALYLSVLARIVLILLPQNDWGSTPGNYLFGIYRNIPFAIMGALLIYWTFQQRAKSGLKHMSLLIFLSFAFYIPVVLWSVDIPAVGSLMMPKTLAYLLIVVLGYRRFIPEFRLYNLLGTAYSFLIMGFVGGVFYREFTKFYGYDAVTHLGKLHVHTLVLGFITLLLFYLILKQQSEGKMETLKKAYLHYLSGLTLTIVSMTVFGIYEVVGQGQPTVNIRALEGISGLGHILLSVGLVWMMLKLLQKENREALPSKR